MNLMYFNKKNASVFLLISQSKFTTYFLERRLTTFFSTIVFSFLRFLSNLNQAFYFWHQNATNALSIIPVISIDFQSKYCAKYFETKQNQKRSKTIEKKMTWPAV